MTNELVHDKEVSLANGELWYLRFRIAGDSP